MATKLSRPKSFELPRVESNATRVPRVLTEVQEQWGATCCLSDDMGRIASGSDWQSYPNVQEKTAEMHHDTGKHFEHAL